MNQAERRGREHLLFFAAASGLPYERRGVPFAESDRVSLRAEPVAEKRELSGFSGAVDAFHYDQLAAVPVRCEQKHALLALYRGAITDRLHVPRHGVPLHLVDESLAAEP